MKTLLLSLAMPPTGFATLVLCGLLLRLKWRRLGDAISWAATAGLMLMALPIVSYSALVALETDLPVRPPADHPPQAIIVLGAEVMRTRQEQPLGARPGLLTLDRLRTAAALERQTNLPLLAAGGTADGHEAPVGLVMERSLRDDFRTPARWVEAKSLDTWENARFSAAILHAEGIDSVYVVTSAWHMRRALLAFRGTGLTVTAAPTPLDDPPTGELFDFLPRPFSWQIGYWALHEWIGLAWYSLR